jgi:hypothetical protein
VGIAAWAVPRSEASRFFITAARLHHRKTQ